MFSFFFCIDNCARTNKFISAFSLAPAGCQWTNQYMVLLNHAIWQVANCKDYGKQL